MIGFTYNNKIQVKFNFDYDVFYCCGVMSLENVQNVKLLINTLKKLKSLFSFMQKIYYIIRGILKNIFLGASVSSTGYFLLVVLLEFIIVHFQHFGKCFNICLKCFSSFILSDPTGQIIEFLIMIYVLGHSGVTYI
jgi:hypothetical protein